MSDKDVEEFLEHIGVKGMKWGFRRSPAKRLEKMNSNAAVTGYGLRGYAAQKVHKKYLKKNNLSAFTNKDFDKLPEKERKRYDAKIKRKAYSIIIGRAIVEPLIIGGAGAIAIKKLNVDPKTKDILKQGFIGFTGISTTVRATEVKAIRDSYKMDKLRKEVYGN